MNHLLFWLLFIVIVSYLSVLLDRRWEKIQRARGELEAARAAQALTATLTDVGTKLTGFATRVAGQWQQQLNGHLKGHQPAVDIPAFRTWLRAMFPPNAPEQGWLTSLSDEQVQILYRGVATFAEDLGFDLVWLLAAKPYKHPTVEQAAKEIVLNYLRSWQQATQSQADVQAMKRYQALLADPTNQENQSFAQQLHAQLMAEGVSPSLPTDLTAADEPAAQQLILENLQMVANQQPVPFSRALRITVAMSKAPTPLDNQPHRKEVTNGHA